MLVVASAGLVRWDSSAMVDGAGTGAGAGVGAGVGCWMGTFVAFVNRAILALTAATLRC